MSDNQFIRSVVRQLRQFQDDPEWMSYAYVGKVLRKAASETLGDFGRIRLRREVSPEQPREIFTVIETDEGDWLVLDTDQFAVLRALVLTWDENDLPPGTTYITPVQLENGSVVSEWQPEHDSANLQDTGDSV